MRYDLHVIKNPVALCAAVSVTNFKAANIERGENSHASTQEMTSQDPAAVTVFMWQKAFSSSTDE